MSEMNPGKPVRDGDTEESDFDPDFQLEPLPRASDILAELPDYPDSDEEKEVRDIMKMIPSTDDTEEGEAVVTEEVSANENTDKDSKTKKRPPSLIKGPDRNKNVPEAPNEENYNVSPVRKSKRQRIEAPKVAEAKLETKVYMNRAGEFMTGFDPTSAEAKYRRELRMQRFGKREKISKSTLEDSKISNDLEDTDDEDRRVLWERRAEAIHLYGTDDLSTDDILEYFSEYGPHRIEWIDDCHCNVVWSETHSVKVALLALSKKFTVEELKAKKEELRRREKDEDEFYLLPGTLDRPPDDEYKGVWRLAVRDNAKAHLLFMRFANTGDVKKRGAYKNSRYYSLYGNPNAPFLSNNNYAQSKQKRAQRVETEKRTNEEAKRIKDKRPPDLRRHLNAGKIDVAQIKEEYKLGKPLVETLTIEVDRDDDANDVEVIRGDMTSESESSSSDSESDESEDSRCASPAPVRQSRPKSRTVDAQQKQKKKPAVIYHSSSSSAGDSSSSSDSSSSDSSSSDSSSSDDSDSSGERVVEIQKRRKPSAKPQVISKRSRHHTPPTSPRKPRLKATQSVAVVRSSAPLPRPKISSQIRSVSGSVGEEEGSRKRRGRDVVSPSRDKRAKVGHLLDLRTKISGRAR